MWHNMLWHGSAQHSLVCLFVHRLQLSNSAAIQFHKPALLLMGTACLPGNVPTLIACMLQNMAVLVVEMFWQLMPI